MNLDELTDEVWRRLQHRKERVLLIGTLPDEDERYCYVNEPPYTHVVIGVLSPGELLQMPSETVCQALLSGIPVWIWPQPYHKGKHGILLRRALLEAEQRLIRFGARPIEKQREKL